MRRMQLDAIETALRRQARRSRKLIHHMPDILPRHPPRRAEQEPHRAPREQPVAQVNRDRARGQRLRAHRPPAGAERRLPAGMADLHDDRRLVRLARVREAGPAGHQVGLDGGVDEVVAGGAEVVGIYLHVSFWSSQRGGAGQGALCGPVRSMPQPPSAHSLYTVSSFEVGRPRASAIVSASAACKSRESV